MKYYLILPEEILEENTNLHTNEYVIGEESFGTFYPDHGYPLLEDLAERFPELLSEIEIRSDQDEAYGIEEFLDHLDTLTVLN